jgi:predicted ATP-grasp superfamily ATP-dependent carboligase
VGLPESLPPCIILGLETQIALGVVRELGRAGVPVIGIAQSRHAIGLRSRYLMRSIIVEQPRSEAMLRCIQGLGEEFGDVPLLTVSEVNLNWLLKHRAYLGKIKPILPTPGSLAIVLDKGKTLAIAESIGIAVPKTVETDSLDAIEQVAASLTFPVVLKWKDPSTIGPKLSVKGIPLYKAEYALNAEQLRTIGKRYLPIMEWPLIQEYCPGVGLGQFFFMREGRALRRFQHVRVAEWPPEGGFSSVCDSVPLTQHVALQEKSIELLRTIGWEGVAMVEYRLDPATGKAVLMEINGRFWGSFPLAVQSGAGFALLAYYVNGLDTLVELGEVRAGKRCRMMATEVKRLVRILLQPKRISDPLFKVEPGRELKRFLSDFFRTGVGYYVWARDDPAPFWSDLTNMLLRR